MRRWLKKILSDSSYAKIRLIGIRNPFYRFYSRLKMGFSLTPSCRIWGVSKGLPLMRYYLESFLSKHAGDIKGNCLEFEADHYIVRYGSGKVTKTDILHIDQTNPRATLIGDLTKPNSFPGNYFDCIICTHVLHVIDDPKKALQELYRMLKPSGVLLIAAPYHSMYTPGLHELWGFTPEGLNYLLTESFGAGHFQIEPYGNVLTAAGNICGVPADFFSKKELETFDMQFVFEICARAVKPGSSSPSA